MASVNIFGLRVLFVIREKTDLFKYIHCYMSKMIDIEDDTLQNFQNVPRERRLAPRNGME